MPFTALSRSKYGGSSLGKNILLRVMGFQTLAVRLTNYKVQFWYYSLRFWFFDFVLFIGLTWARRLLVIKMAIPHRIFFYFFCYFNSTSIKAWIKRIVSHGVEISLEISRLGFRLLSEVTKFWPQFLLRLEWWSDVFRNKTSMAWNVLPSF